MRKAIKVNLSEKQKRILKENADGTHTPLHLKIRSQIILYASEGRTNDFIEDKMGIDGKTVTKWRSRYNKQYEELSRIEAETPHGLRSAIKKTLSDEARSGCPPKFSD